MLCAALLCSPSAFADEKAEVAAAKLLDAMNMEAIFADMIDASLEAQLAQKPELVPYREVFRTFLAKHMSYAALKPEIARVYATEFSADELNEATAFYTTPTGQKFLARMPSLFSQGAQIGQAAVTEHLPELEQAILAESQRLQDANKPDDGEA